MSTLPLTWPQHPEAQIPDHIEGLIFDCDGTLIDTMPVHFHAWTRALQNTGILLPEQKFYALAGMPTQKIIETLAAEQGVAAQAAELALLKEKLYMEALASAPAIAAVVDIARRERGRRKLAVASGGWQRVVRHSLSGIGILDIFDTIVGADDVTHGKPHPDVFLLAARRLGLRPEQCAVYEDGELGFQAARAAGMSLIDVRPWYLPRT